MARADVTVVLPSQAGGLFTGGGTGYIIKTAGDVYYWVYIDINTDVAFKKSSDGFTWSTPTIIFTGSALQLSVWYDRWSGIAAGLIHLAYSESGGDDVLYRSIDTESSDALSTQTVIFAGTAAVGSGGALSITRARGGNLGCIFNTDTGTEDGFSKSTDVGASWSAAADPTEATTDFWILLPGWAADNQDLMCFFWDRSADEISRKLYDDSGDSWAETSISGSMVEGSSSTAFPHFAAAVDITNSRNLLVAWNGVDTANADLKCWHVTESAITALTDVVTNGTDDQGLCAIGIDTATEDWYVFYGGKSDGTETWNTSLNIYYKVSTDDGSTWGSETQLTTTTYATVWLICPPRFSSSSFIAGWHTNISLFSGELRASVLIPSAGSGGLIGTPSKRAGMQ